MKIHNGNNIDILKTYPDNYFDSIVTDPPYGIEFLAKAWDSNTGAVETWAECYRVLKPGGYILAFSAARTYHNLATNIEGVGFEIRDQIMWLYASGFPKAQDMGKAIEKREGKRATQTTVDIRPEYSVHPKSSCPKCQLTGNGTNWQKCTDSVCPQKQEPCTNEWAGWKTALKPAHEPIVMARKPFKGSCIDNVLTHGLGALNIDASRVKRESAESRYPSNVLGEVTDYQKFFYCPKVSRAERHIGFEAPEPEPFNNPDEMKKHPLWDPSIGTNSHRLMQKIREHQKNNPLAHIPSTKGGFLGTDGEWNPEHWHSEKGGRNKPNLDHIPTNPNGMLQDRYESGMQVGMYQDTKENQGVAPNKDSMVEEMGGHWITDANGDSNMCFVPHLGKIYVHGLRDEYIKWCKANNKPTQNMGNNHPTVKPVELMKYLVKLVTPAGGKVLDPFCGSGSTGMAAVELDYDFTGCELDPDYVNIATQRITAWKNKTDLNNNPLPEQWFTTGE